MVVLVLGSSGSLGRSLQDIVRDSNIVDDIFFFASRADADLRQRDEVVALLQRTGASRVIHLAATFGHIGFMKEHPATILSDNVLISASVLEACRLCRVELIVSVLSTYVFTTSEADMVEENALVGDPEPTIYAYAESKRLLLRMSEAYSAEHKLRTVCLIPCNLYGPHDEFDEKQGHLVAGLLTRARSAAEDCRSLVAWGSGAPIRQLMYAPDFARILLWAVQKQHLQLPTRLIVAPREAHTIKEVAECVAYVVSSGKLAVEWDGSRPDGHRRLYANSNQYFALRPDATFTPLAVGVRETLAALVARHPRPHWGPGRSASMQTHRRSLMLRLSTLSSGRTFPLCDNRLLEEDRLEAIKLLAMNQQLSMGSKVAALESEYARFIGAKHAVFVNSGSSANLLMAHTLTHVAGFPWGQLLPGDKVLVPAVCWSTSVAPLLQFHLEPVLVDVDPTCLQMSIPDFLAKAARPGVKALMLVHVLGPSADMEIIIAECARRNIVVLEDACEVMGNSCRGKMLGTFGLMGAFSTYYSHHMCSVEGGFVVTDNDVVADALRSTRAHGWTRGLSADSELVRKRGVDLAASDIDHRFQFILPGFNVRNTDLHAAICLSQLSRLSRMNAVRIQNMRRFRAALAMITVQVGSLVWVPSPCAHNGDVAWLSLPLLAHPHVKLCSLKTALESAGVETRPIVSGNMARQPFLSGVSAACDFKLPGADEVHDHGLYVGLHATAWSESDALDLASRVVCAALQALQ